jgi:ribosomal protein L39E
MANRFSNQASEAKDLSEALNRSMPAWIDGKVAIEVMRSEGSRNWRQMEWIGWWLEHIVEQHVTPDIGGSRGPKYGKTEFDLKRNYVWDLKVHLENNDWLILNDQEAVSNCLDEYEGLGYLIVEGSADFDVDGKFKDWHSLQKGGISKYEEGRIKRGANSRIRKKSFTAERILAIWIPGADDVLNAVKSGWIKGFQEGMRNSNGNARRSKFQINLGLVPEEYVLLDHQIIS